MKHTYLFLPLIFLPLLGCEPSDAGSADGSIVVEQDSYPLQACQQTLSLSNQSSQPLVMSVSVESEDSNAGCEDPSADSSPTLVVLPGTQQTLSATLYCEYCGVGRFYSVTNLNRDIIYYNETEGGPEVTCIDSGCITR
jgi:hypothetical protein